MIFFHKSLFLFSSFVAGFALMTLELVSARIVAPIIGSSVYTWTSVIGVTILGLAVGSLLGGYFADKYPKETTLAIAFATASILTFIIPGLAAQTDFIVASNSSILAMAVYLSLFLFLLPSIAIGSLSPIILKLFAENFSSIGKEYAAVSATWSFGSILGIFLTGFVFVAKIGSQETLSILAGILFLFAAVFAIIGKSFRKVAGFSLILGIAGLSASYAPKQINENVVYEKETAYYLARVIDSPSGIERFLFLDFDSHSIETKYHPNGLYTEIYPIFGQLNQDIKNIHIIGAGAYTMPKDFAEHYPDATVSVTEIDPEVKVIGEKYFELDSARIRTIETDARVYLSRTDEKFDVIFGDAFNSFISVPWHLMTLEFNEQVKTRLEDGGVYAVNFIGVVESEDEDVTAVTRSMIKTFSQTFPNFYVFATGRTPIDVQNIVLVGINSDNRMPEAELKAKIATGKYGPILARYLVPKNDISAENGLIFTDNFAPVEDMMCPVMKQYFPSFLAFINETLGK